MRCGEKKIQKEIVGAMKMRQKKPLQPTKKFTYQLTTDNDTSESPQPHEINKLAH